MTSSQPYTDDNLHFITGTEENSFVFKRIAIHRDTETVSQGTSMSFVIQLELSELKETTSGLWESGQQLCFCCPPRRH